MQPHQQVKYYSKTDIFVLKLNGSLRFTCAPYLDEAIKKIDTHQKENIIFDLTQASYIDSTIMGGIAKFFLQDQTGEQKKPIIVYKGDDIKLMFTKIGFDRFFNFTKEDKRTNINAQDLIGFSEIKPDAKKLKESIKSAHQILSDLNPEDPGYKEVVQALKDK